jgi:hypothetical protein
VQHTGYSGVLQVGPLPAYVLTKARKRGVQRTDAKSKEAGCPVQRCPGSRTGNSAVLQCRSDHCMGSRMTL